MSIMSSKNACLPPAIGTPGPTGGPGPTGAPGPTGECTCSGPGGGNQMVQFNDSGVLAGAELFKWDKTFNQVTTQRMRLNWALSINTKRYFSNHALDETNYTALVGAVSGPVTISLPPAASAGGRIYNVKKVDASINAVTVAADGAELIDGSNTKILSTQYDTIQIQSNGAQWWVI